MSINDYKLYISQKGNTINKELKNNIYTSGDCLTKLLLVDYILDTLINYNYKNCPEYNETIPLLPENVVHLIITEIMDSILITEDEQYLIVSENSNTSILQEILTSEDDINFLEAEGDLEKYLFDKSFIENYLINLTKDITC